MAPVPRGRCPAVPAHLRFASPWITQARPARPAWLPTGSVRSFRPPGPSRAFGELYDYYLPRIYGFIFRRVQERSVAEDITSTTFQRGLEALRRGTFRNDAFGGWLYRVAANAVVDHVRAGNKVVRMDTRRPPPTSPRSMPSPRRSSATSFGPRCIGSLRPIGACSC